MAETEKNELNEGKKQLTGVLILCWVMAVITGIAVLSGTNQGWVSTGLINRYFDGPFTFFAARDLIENIFTSLTRTVYSLVIPALYIVELIGIYNRRSFAIPLGRAVLVVTMVFFFPVGTIFGAILWKRVNNDISKKYLNYGE